MERISEIIEEKRVVKLYTDTGEELFFCKALWRKAPLFHIDQEINTEELKNWMLVQQYPYSLRYAIDLLSRRDHSSGEIAKKLRQRFYLEETIEMVLFKLQKEKLLDDRKFAEQYSSSCVRKQYGKARIRRSLQQKGVDHEIIDEVLGSLNTQEADQAIEKIASKLLLRYAGEKDPRKKRAKLMAAMARRGYGFDESRRALEKVEKEEQ